MFGSRADDTLGGDLAGTAGTARAIGAWPLILAVLAGIGGFAFWAATHEIEEVTRGMGRVIPSSQVQVVQSPEAGVVTSIDVAPGDVVVPGQVLMQIDDTGLAAQRGELLEREAGLMAETARVAAEASGADEIAFPEGLEARAPGAVAAERRVFASRRAQLQTEMTVLADQLAQRDSELAELRATRAKLLEVVAPLEREVTLTEDLASRGAVPEIEVLRLQARLAEARGELQVLEATEPKLAAAISAAKNQMASAEGAYRLTAEERLARLQVELAVVREGLRAAENRVTRAQLRAPVRGTVNTVAITTLGAVIQPGAPLVEIVPIEDGLLIEAEVRPQDVAFIEPGDRASVKITAYDYLVYGSLPGTVERIGADTIANAEGTEFFRVVVRTDETALERGGERFAISAGMVAQIDIQTGRKTVLSYLAKPILRAQSEALRER